jgi:translocation and assembly module TamA
VLRSLREQWSLAVGGEFRNSDWSDAKTALLTRLRAAGYPAASWSGTQATVDPAASEARLFLVADSGPLFLAGELQIEGLQRQDADTVRHLANFAPGVPVTEALLLDFQERLQKAGLFESVSVAVDPDPAQAARAAIQVQLREQALQVWTVGLGISANNGPRTSVEHVHRRFLGAAINASNKIEWGQKRQTWSGELSTHAQAGLRRHLLGGVIERQESDTDLVVSQRLRLGRAHDGQRLERLYFVEAERGERREAGQRTTTFALSGNGHMVLRRLDSAVLPTDGYTLSLQLGAGRSHGNRSASGPFGRAYSRLTVYRPLGRSWYGQARVELGQVFLGGAVAAPDSQLWRAGGDDSVRGYAYRSLGPVVGGGVASGSVLATASVELARPLFEDMPSLWGAVFADAGRAATSFGGLNPALGLGAGVRWRSPVGPLRLDIARGQETGQWRLHFSVAIAF